ncbi:hypothetical protein EDC04DRAFT_2605720 [Pisolithus marmoratus]|nr:hypothetical protein EDC04DRAFT_2605720 [Pisolithus marmoratus]
MSQNIANTSLPTPTATQDWTAILEEAIQSASDDDKETANAKYTKCQCRKHVRKECKAAKEAAACEKVEAERQEQEFWEKEEHAYTVDSETEWSEMPVVDRLRVSVPVGDRLGMSVLVPAETGNPGLAEGSKVKGKAKACDPVPVGPCAQCVRAGVECMFKLVRASAEKKKK